jgi:hypothetical protein
MQMQFNFLIHLEKNKYRVTYTLAWISFQNKQSVYGGDSTSFSGKRKSKLKTMQIAFSLLIHFKKAYNIFFSIQLKMTICLNKNSK